MSCNSCESENHTYGNGSRPSNEKNLRSNLSDIVRHTIPIQTDRCGKTDSTSGNHRNTERNIYASQSENCTDTD